MVTLQILKRIRRKSKDFRLISCFVCYRKMSFTSELSPLGMGVQSAYVVFW